MSYSLAARAGARALVSSSRAVGVRTVIAGAGPFTPLVELFRAPADSVWFTKNEVPALIHKNQTTPGDTFERFPRDQIANAVMFALFAAGITFGIAAGEFSFSSLLDTHNGVLPLPHSLF